MYCIVLWCVVCVVLCCVALCCSVVLRVYCTILYWMMLNWVLLYCVVLYCITSIVMTTLMRETLCYRFYPMHIQFLSILCILAACIHVIGNLVLKISNFTKLCEYKYQISWAPSLNLENVTRSVFQDTSSKMFVLFEFSKSATIARKDFKTGTPRLKLKPCIYKRR